MKIKNLGFIFKPVGNLDWWKSHAMAPAPILLDEDTVRIFIGCWNESNISRIGFIDVDSKNPKEIKLISDRFVLDIGEDGCFDENGVFPGHAYRFKDGTIYLYYTGFQLGQKIRYYNFGGLAISKDGGDTFKRYSQAPIMDRADEGLFVRAGQSIELAGDKTFHMVYSAGSGWHECKGQMRPVYDVFYQNSPDGIEIEKAGEKIISCDFAVGHGLGRPQIIKLGKYFYVFYTRRIVEDMKYFIGASRSLDGKSWERVDDMFDGVLHGAPGEFNHEMIYFPSVVKTEEGKALLFYSGNYFGRDGIGSIELEF